MNEQGALSLRKRNSNQMMNRMKRDDKFKGSFSNQNMNDYRAVSLR